MIALRAAPLLGMLIAGPAAAQTLAPQEVFRRVAPSVVVIEVKDVPKTGNPRLIASGSGVIIPDRSKDEVLVATNCHVVDQSPNGYIYIQQGDDYGIGEIESRDAERDLCLVRGLMFDERDLDKKDASPKKLPAVQVGSSQWLEVGDTVYAVGAPQGLELSLSNGLVSGFRQHKSSEYIQTTAPISKGSSGGGLFDAQGRLVGITTMYVKDGQALNFAVPAELIASVPRYGSRGTTIATPPPVAPHSIKYASNDDIRWIYVGTSRADKGVMYLNRKTAIKSAGNVTAWLRTTYDLPHKDRLGDTYDETTTLYTFYCSTRQISSLSVLQRLDGNVVYSKTHETDKVPVVPDSIGEAAFEIACSL